MNFFEKLGVYTIAMPIAIFISYVMLGYSYMTYGYVIYITWPWLIPTELIKYIPGYWQSVSIYFMLRVLINNGIGTSKPESIKKDYYDSDDYRQRVIISLSKPWMLILFGYIVKKHFFFW